MKVFYFSLVLLLANFVLASNLVDVDVCHFIGNETETQNHFVDNTNKWGVAILLASLIFGKSVELALLPEWSKPAARGVGKLAKAFQGRQGALEMLGSAVSGFGAVVLSQRVQRSDISSNHIAAMSVALLSTQKFLEQPGNWEAFNYWFGKPVLYKSALWTCRYALEKRVQELLRHQISLSSEIAWIIAHSNFSEESARNLAKSTIVGMSKMASTAIAASTISIVDISLDAMKDDPQWKTFLDRLQKYIQDMGVALGTSFVISVMMPVTLVSSTPRVLIGVFVIGNAIHWVFFS